MIHTVKAFGIVNKADIFLELSCFYDPKDVGNLISGSSAFSGFPDSSVDKESACNVGDLGSSPGLGRSPGQGKGYPLQYSGLENSMDCSVRTEEYFFLSDKGCGALASHP